MADPIDVTSISDAEAAPAGLPAQVAERLATFMAMRGRVVLVARQGGVVVGLLVGLRRKTTALLRISWFWVGVTGHQRDGVGQALISTLEHVSRQSDIVTWRIGADTSDLDVPRALRALTGIAQHETGADYCQRALGNAGAPLDGRAPSYTQSTGFTCGPASLAMAFAAFDPALVLDRHLEIALWREATTIVGLVGPGGCDPYGLALAVASRGYGLKLFMSTPDPVLLDRANSESKRDLMRFVQADFKARVLAGSVEVEHRPFALAELKDGIAAGAIGLVLIDQIETHGRSTPHWIVVHAVGEEWCLVNDPWFETDAGETGADVVNLPVRWSTLDRMAWYGEPRYRAALLINHAET